MHKILGLADDKQRDEWGFTLLELMVVVMVMAILIGIAVPTFLGVRKRSQNVVAQTRVRTIFVAARVIYVENKSFGQNAPAFQSSLQSWDPSFDFVIGNTSAPGEFSVAVAGGKGTISTQSLIMTRSEAGRCFGIWDNLDLGGEVLYGDVDPNGQGECNATSIILSGKGEWTSDGF